MKTRSRSLILASFALLFATAGARAASVPRFERQFLGIRLMSRGVTVLRKYGSPTRVLNGTNVKLIYQILALPTKDFLTIAVDNLGGDATGGAANPYDAASGGPAAPVNPYASNMATQGGGAPGLGDTAGQTVENKILFWVYQYPAKGITNVFILDEEGRVIGIAQAGGKPAARTARGVGIGSPYSNVVRVYGFPDQHTTIQTAGATPVGMLGISYAESHGTEFAFLNRNLRGYPKYTTKGPWCVGVIVLAAGM